MIMGENYQTPEEHLAEQELLYGPEQGEDAVGAQDSAGTHGGEESSEEDDEQGDLPGDPPAREDHDPDLIIVTGMSGAGRTEAMHTFEDYGYFCIDNLPPQLLMNLVGLAVLPGDTDHKRKLAVVCDIRNQTNFYLSLREELRHVHDAGLRYRIIFLDARDEVLISRYKESRRIHPISTVSNQPISQAIHAERELLAELREAANVVIDTSGMKPNDLRRQLKDLFAADTMMDGLRVVVYSFGFKHGAPVDADIVIDVRFLPNPFYVTELRNENGLAPAVQDYVLNQPETEEFLINWHNLLACVMPAYRDEGKQQITIAVGCTGGQHRSVTLADETARYLKGLGYNVYLSHRDLPLAPVAVEGA